MPRFQGIPLEQVAATPQTEEAKTKPRFKGEPMDAAKEDGEFSTIEMLKNIPESGGNLIKNIYQAVTNPIKTAKALEKTASGGLFKASQKLDEITPDWLDFANEPIANLIFDVNAPLFGEKDKVYAEAFGKALKDRYGSVDNMKATIESDPVGAAVDVAALLSGVGGVVKGTAGLTKSAGLAKTGEALTKAGTAIDPLGATTRAAKTVVKEAVPKGLPAKMYEDVAKFSTTTPAKKRAKMITTALENKIMPTTKGVEKLEGLVSGLNSKIDTLITSAQQTGKTIPRAAIYQGLKDLRMQKGGVRLDAPGDLKAINKIVKSFETHLSGLKKENLTPKDLQKLKVEAYKSINWDAKRMTGAPIKEDTYKAIAKGAKENIEKLAPGTKETNKKLAALLDLQPGLQRAANRIENRNLIPIDAPLQIGAGSAVGGPGGALAGTAMSVMGLPKVKAKTALELQSLIDASRLETLLKGNTGLSRAQLAAVLAGRATENDP